MSEKPDETGSARDDWTEDHTGKGGVSGAPVPVEDVPDSSDVDTHAVVSGGGVVEREDLGPEESEEAATEVD
jgi:hypothetical protein